MLYAPIHHTPSHTQHPHPYSSAHDFACASVVVLPQAKRYDACMQRYESAAVSTAQSLAQLNLGQSWIFTAAITAAMAATAHAVMAGTATVGDLVMVQGLLFQVCVAVFVTCLHYMVGGPWGFLVRLLIYACNCIAVADWGGASGMIVVP